MKETKPEHGFVGRERELAEAERRLNERPILAIAGEHDEGKSAFAAELVRRLAAGPRFQNAAWVDLEACRDVHAVRFALGRQLVPQYKLAVSQGEFFAAQLLERVLREQPSVVVFDQWEALLPGPGSVPGSAEPAVLEQVLELASNLAKIGRTRLVLASREPLPEPWGGNVLRLGGLEPDDAVTLVGNALATYHARSLAEAETAAVAVLASRVGHHAGALLSLADTLAALGTSAAAEILDELEARLPPDLGERQRALRLGIKLGLRRFSGDLDAKVAPLACFHGGGHLTAIAAVLELDVEDDEEIALAEELIAARLATMGENNYLRLHPSLADVLRPRLGGEGLRTSSASWAEATLQLIGFLYREQIKNPRLASSLATDELPNLLACLEHVRSGNDPETVAEVAAQVEALVGPLGRPAALARIEEVRDEATRQAGEWDREQYLAELSAVELLMDLGRPQETVSAARKLLHRAEVHGEEAYEEAAYDLATTRLTLGLAQLMAGDNEAAKASLEKAHGGFQELAMAGDVDAAKMEAVALARTGDALRALGFPEGAGKVYEEAIEMSRGLGDRRQVAEIQTQLGALLLNQGHAEKALTAFEDARQAFTALGEPRAVSGIWHQVAQVHEGLHDPSAAEAAVRRALELELEAGDRLAAATTLGAIGHLAGVQGRLEEAVDHYRRAAEVFAEEGDLVHEGIARSQLADKLMALGRHDEARRELERTVECDAPFGHEVEPWRTYSMLSRLEEMAGNEPAARAARERAIAAYLAYRRDGGEDRTGHGEIFAEVTEAIAKGRTAEVASRLEGMARRRDLPAKLGALIPALLALLNGSRENALAVLPNLYYRDAAELLLQIEELEGS